MNQQTCWKCNRSVEIKISFRTVCPHCDVDLHVCRNCRYYAPGKPNDCSVPGTDSIRDRERANFCEEFALRSGPPIATGSDWTKAKRLFGDD